MKWQLGLVSAGLFIFFEKTRRVDSLKQAFALLQSSGQLHCR